MQPENYMMRIMLMRIIDKEGNLLAEHERPHVTKAIVPTVRMVRKGIATKAKPRTKVVNTEEFLRLTAKPCNGSL